GLADVAGNTRDRGHADDAAVLVEHVPGEQFLVDGECRGEVDGQHRVPPVLAHVREFLVLGDARVVHHDVHAAVPFVEVSRQFLGRFGGGDVQLQCRTAHLVGHLGEFSPLCGDVQADDVGAVAGKYLRDRGTDAAG